MLYLEVLLECSISVFLAIVCINNGKRMVLTLRLFMLSILYTILC